MITTKNIPIEQCPDNIRTWLAEQSQLMRDKAPKGPDVRCRMRIGLTKIHLVLLMALAVIVLGVAALNFLRHAHSLSNQRLLTHAGVLTLSALTFWWAFAAMRAAMGPYAGMVLVVPGALLRVTPTHVTLWSLKHVKSIVLSLSRAGATLKLNSGVGWTYIGFGSVFFGGLSWRDAGEVSSAVEMAISSSSPDLKLPTAQVSPRPFLIALAVAAVTLVGVFGYAHIRVMQTPEVPEKEI